MRPCFALIVGFLGLAATGGCAPALKTQKPDAAASRASKTTCSLFANEVDLNPSGDFFGGTVGDTRLLVVVAGEALVNDVSLKPGDIYVHTQSGGALGIRGNGRAIFVASYGQPYRWGDPVLHDQVLRAADGKKVRIADGKMQVTLHLEPASPRDVYVGWLEGSAGVPEHVHLESCEVIVVLEGAGTLLRNRKAERVKTGDVVTVEPGERHEWRPDPDTSLRALQLYAPRGPEQRFLQP